jgi:hypothetical protein
MATGSHFDGIYLKNKFHTYLKWWEVYMETVLIISNGPNDPKSPPAAIFIFFN